MSNGLCAFLPSPSIFSLFDVFSDNVKTHGAHPWYLHALVNMPMLFGPLIAFLLLAVFLIHGLKSSCE